MLAVLLSAPASSVFLCSLSFRVSVCLGWKLGIEPTLSWLCFHVLKHKYILLSIRHFPRPINISVKSVKTTTKVYSVCAVFSPNTFIRITYTLHRAFFHGSQLIARHNCINCFPIAQQILGSRAIEECLMSKSKAVQRDFPLRSRPNLCDKIPLGLTRQL